MSMTATIKDIVDGARSHEFWVTFAQNDIKSKYRRSRLGQIWITLSVAIFIGVIGSIYNTRFSSGMANYMAYLTVGYIVWLFMSDIMVSGCNVLIKAKAFMLQKPWPISVFYFRYIYSQILTNLHHCILIIPVFLWLELWPGLQGIVLALLGYLWMIFSAFWVSMLVSITAVRYRDFAPIIQSLMRMAFFATPVFWVYHPVGDLVDKVIQLNPFFYYVSIVRDPLLTGTVSLNEWLISVGMGLTVMVLALVVFSRTRNKIIYWL